ncbi:MAG TPA: hypothetical protein VME92_07240 [Acetobacteraceae bacterium]|nr:hypothetical protein [Acetobacteraceae bacterium]
MLLAGALGGCYSMPTDTPVAWWHQLEGGQIAKERPPPPGVTEPYPALGTVPPRPVVPPPTVRDQIANALAVDRTVAQQQAALAPLPAPQAPVPAGSKAPAGAPASAPPSGGAMATLDAASAPPPPAAPAPTATPAPAAPAAAPAQTAPPQSGAAVAPGPRASAAGAPAAGSAKGAVPSPVPAGAASGTETGLETLPPVPQVPPPAPALPGIAVPTLPPPRPAALPPPPAAPPLPPLSPNAVPVNFATDSSILPRDARGLLSALAARRGGHVVNVIGRGEAVSADPALQAAGLQLGVLRAQAIASWLADAGVPQAAMRLGAEAAGRGGYARLVD